MANKIRIKREIYIKVLQNVVLGHIQVLSTLKNLETVCKQNLTHQLNKNVCLE
jgi:hypothetical protein